MSELTGGIDYANLTEEELDVLERELSTESTEELLSFQGGYPIISDLRVIHRAFRRVEPGKGLEFINADKRFKNLEVADPAIDTGYNNPPNERGDGSSSRRYECEAFSFGVHHLQDMLEPEPPLDLWVRNEETEELWLHSVTVFDIGFKEITNVESMPGFSILVDDEGHTQVQAVLRKRDGTHVRESGYIPYEELQDLITNRMLDKQGIEPPYDSDQLLAAITGEPGVYGATGIRQTEWQVNKHREAFSKLLQYMKEGELTNEDFYKFFRLIQYFFQPQTQKS